MTSNSDMQLDPRTLPDLAQLRRRSQALAMLDAVGGLDWKEVHKLIHQNLETLTIPVFVYANYQKGVAANEPGLPSQQAAV